MLPLSTLDTKFIPNQTKIYVIVNGTDNCAAVWNSNKRFFIVNEMLSRYNIPLITDIIKQDN